LISQDLRDELIAKYLHIVLFLIAYTHALYKLS